MKGILATLCLLPTFTLAWAQAPDPQLLVEINQIKAIDTDSHAPKLVEPKEKDAHFDARPCAPLAASVPTTVSRPENPQYLAAWKALYNYPYNDMSPAHVRELMQAKQKVIEEQGDNFPNWVLDQLGIESELANRVAMGRGLRPPRFRWVPFDDALLLPLKNSDLAVATADRKFFYQRESDLLRRYLRDLRLSSLPSTLNDYLVKVVTPVLEKQKQDGAVAVKFEAAYLRSLDFGPPEAEVIVEKIYSRFIHEGVPSKAEYLRLQNFLFRNVAREAGRLGLPVHIHTGGGCGTYFNLMGSNPALLESVLSDPALRKTNFVLLHGGPGAFTKYTAYLLMKPNGYSDFSEQTWLISTRALSQVIRDFLEWNPEKIIFCTHLHPTTPAIHC